MKVSASLLIALAVSQAATPGQPAAGELADTWATKCPDGGSVELSITGNRLWWTKRTAAGNLVTVIEAEYPFTRLWEPRFIVQPKQRFLNQGVKRQAQFLRDKSGSGGQSSTGSESAERLLRPEAEFGVAWGSILYGIITRIESGPPAGPSRWDTFLFRFRVAKGQLDVESLRGRGFAAPAFMAFQGRYTVKQTRPLLSVQAHAKAASCVQFSPDGTRLASGGQDHRAAVWDAASGKRLLALAEHSDAPLASLSFSPDGKRLATWDRSPAVRVWDTETGKSLLTLPGLGKPIITHVAFGPGGQTLASLGQNHPKEEYPQTSLLVWDAHTGRKVAALRATDDAICFAYAANGKRLATGGWFGTVTVWELASGKRALTVRSRRDYSMALSRDGGRLATTGEDGMVRVWALPSGRESWSSKGYKLYATRITFSPDGRRLASAGLNRRPTKQPPRSETHRNGGEVIVWDAATGQKRGVLRFGVGESPNDVSFSPDGRRLVTAHEDGTVRIWAVEQLLGRPQER